MPYTAKAMPRLCERKRVVQDRLLAGLQSAAADSLQNAEEDQHAQTVRRNRTERAEREDRQRRTCKSACARSTKKASRRAAEQSRWKRGTTSAPRWLRLRWRKDFRECAATQRWRWKCPRTSMNVASVTVTAITQGLIEPSGMRSLIVNLLDHSLSTFSAPAIR